MTETDEHPLLEVSHLCLLHNDQSLVGDFSFHIRKGERVALVGESGAGKSLLAKAVLQLTPPGITMSGEVSFSGQPASQVQRSLQKGHLAYIPQDPFAAAFPLYTIQRHWQHVCEARQQAFNRREAASLLEDIGLPAEAILRSYPHQLSGGELQRALIAMAFIDRPKLIIADEPTTALDTVNQAAVLRLIHSYCLQYQASLLFITHDLSVVGHLCERVIVMQKGRMVEDNSVATLLNLPVACYSRELLEAQRRLHRASSTVSLFSDKQRPILEAKELNVSYFPGGLRWNKRRVTAAVRNVSCQLFPGAITGLVGKSGSGKTTLLRSLAGLLPGAHSQVSFHGQRLSGLKQDEWSRYRTSVQLIYQNPGSSLNPRMTARDILGEALKLGKRETNLALRELLDWVKLPEGLLRRYPFQLSGGEQQRLCIARALAVQPQVLLCDEPTSSLDHSLQSDLLDLFIYLKKEFNLGILLISHNLTSIRYTCDFVAVMDDGEIKETGPAQKVLNSPITPYTRQLLKAEPTLTHNFLLENPHE